MPLPTTTSFCFFIADILCEDQWALLPISKACATFDSSQIGAKPVIAAVSAHQIDTFVYCGAPSLCMRRPPGVLAGLPVILLRP
jgi:hypothetical protein